jgi:hypothetical protein
VDKKMTYKELKKFALEHYEEGGDGVYECWDEKTFNEYVAEFGEITEEKALAMFHQYDEICKEYRATAW